ncbi:MAG: universal stress protein [Saprospiraceae bacterium]|nr:universal stress protein [Saprospiraceae bacterium]
MKKILVPTDFSKNAKHALRVAATIATKTGARLGLMHTNTALAYAPVLPEYNFIGSYDMKSYYDMVADEFRHTKKSLVAEPGFEELDIDTRIEEGLLYASIRRVAEEDKADLVVIGTKGATGAAEFFVGSNTEKVIRTAPCPVLAVPEESGDFDLKTVVLPSTLEKNQMPVFEQLAEWQRHWPFTVKVLYLNNPAMLRSEQEIEQVAGSFAQKAGLNNFSVHTLGSNFNEEASILQFAARVGADLIAMGTHQRRGLSHLLFGSLTEDTVNHSKIPVLSVAVR